MTINTAAPRPPSSHLNTSAKQTIFGFSRLDASNGGDQMLMRKNGKNIVAASFYGKSRFCVNFATFGTAARHKLRCEYGHDDDE